MSGKVMNNTLNFSKNDENRGPFEIEKRKIKVRRQALALAESPLQPFPDTSSSAECQQENHRRLVSLVDSWIEPGANYICTAGLGLNSSPTTQQSGRQGSQGQKLVKHRKSTVD